MNLEGLLGIHDSIANKIAPNGAYCLCEKCGQRQDVDAAACLRKGWPRCCGYTMTFHAKP